MTRLVATWLMLLLIVLGAGPQVARADEPAETDDYELLSVLIDTLDEVQRNYVQDISRRELLEAAIQGVLSKLDPYSSYIRPEEIRRFRTSVENKFGGIGIQVTSEDGRLKVISPLVGTPAYRAGILAGDWIIEIEGQSIQGITLEEAVRRLQGEPGTEVQITVLHPGLPEPRSVTLTREIIRVETVLGDSRRADGSWNYMVDDSERIGYIRVTAFSRDTAADLKAAIEQLLAEGMQGLVLDLRFNPGGLLSAAIEVSDLFISSGTIVSTEGRNSAPQHFEATEEGTLGDFPMAILVNRGSASASEIVAACLQDHGRAIVVGERTWGKGSVQNVIEMEGGRSALKLTTASYARPSGAKIHRFPDDDEDDAWGVLPSDGYEVALGPVELRELVELRRQKDVFVGLVSAQTEGPAAGPSTDDSDENKPGDEKPADDKPADEPVDDEPSSDAAPGDEKPADDAPADDDESSKAPADEDPADDAEPRDAPDQQAARDAEPSNADAAPADSAAPAEATDGDAPADEQPADEQPAPEAAESSDADEAADDAPRGNDGDGDTGSDSESDSDGDEAKPSENAPADDESAPPEDEGAGDTPGESRPKRLVDRQLEKALEYVRSQLAERD